MTAWWTSLSTDLQIFWAIGVIFLGITIIQLLLSLFGIGGDLADFDVPGGDSSSGAGLFSSQTLSAFFLGFGWVGAIVRSAGVGLMLSIMIAVVLGLVVMGAMYLLVRLLLKLQSRGNIDYSSAIGNEATVYVTLPGNDEDGGGQIQVVLQGRMRVASARKVSPGPLNPGTKVRITGMFAETTFNVEPITSPQPSP